MYKYLNATSVRRLNDGASIPFAEGNRDFTEFQGWVAAGNIPEPADVPPMPTYRELRAAAYPPVTDGLDALVKGGQAWEEYKAACLAVKAKYPKP